MANEGKLTRFCCNTPEDEDKITMDKVDGGWRRCRAAVASVVDRGGPASTKEQVIAWDVVEQGS